MKLINIFTRKIEIMDWNEYHEYIEMVSLHTFQQQTRQESLKNLALQPTPEARAKNQEVRQALEREKILRAIPYY